jgi:nitrogen fixation protein NifZ
LFFSPANLEPAMMEPREPLYPWGLPVLAIDDLFNDGSFPEAEPGALLVPAATRGEIVQVGHHSEANIPIYLVEFDVDGKPVVLGCFEEELLPADALPKGPPAELLEAQAVASAGANSGSAPSAA